MMEQATEAFDIIDFTTSSDWERFIFDLEEIIRQRDLASGRCKSIHTGPPSSSLNQSIHTEPSSSSLNQSIHTGPSTSSFNQSIHTGPSTSSLSQWHEEVDEIRFAKIKFLVTHCWTTRTNSKVETLRSDGSLKDNSLPIALQDINDPSHDFSIRPLVGRFYGLCEYLLLSTNGSADVVTSEDNLKLLVGSVNIALQNTQCQIPAFVQVHGKKLNIYQGKVCGNNECSVPVDISVRFTQILRKWPSDSLFQHHPIDAEDPPKDISNVLDFVAYRDPVIDLRLFTTWDSLSEELVSDSQFHSDLDPMQAPFWSVRVTFDDPAQLSSSLSEILGSFFSLSSQQNRSKQILGGLIQEIEEDEAENEVRQALDRISNQNTLSLNLPQIKLPKRSFLIPQNIVSSLLSYIFEDPSATEVMNDFRHFKSAPFDSLSWRIVHVLTFVYSSYKDLPTLAIFWKEIINELRRFWENSHPLPGIEEGRPNQATCLLHQKLQMLDCCIREKVKWDSRRSKGSREDQDEAEEFFDAQENVESGPGNGCEGIGRLEKYKDLTLLCDPQVPVYVPICQEPTPLTDDMLQEQTEIMSQLGSSHEASTLRMRMQLPTLVCDMESFKAANPRGKLEDFVRWYSPRDFDDSEGGLSQRMKHDGNIWSKSWNEAKPVPASKQKRLFDFTKEAEKVLHYLTSFSLESLVQHFMPILIHSSYSLLLQERDALGFSDEQLSIKCSNPSNFEHSLSFIRRIETKILVMKSLKAKLQLSHEYLMSQEKEEKKSLPSLVSTTPSLCTDGSISRKKENNSESNSFEWEKVKPFVLKLASDPEVSLKDGSNGYFSQLLMALFNLSAESKPPESELEQAEESSSTNRKESSPSYLKSLSAKEFILRVTLPRPGLNSKPLPQRLYCLMTATELRMAGVFSEDTSFL